MQGTAEEEFICQIWGCFWFGPTLGYFGDLDLALAELKAYKLVILD